MSYNSLLTTAIATSGLNHLNFVIAFCVIGAIYLFELYLIVTHKRNPPNYATAGNNNNSNNDVASHVNGNTKTGTICNRDHSTAKLSYTDYYGSTLGFIIYKLDEFGYKYKYAKTIIYILKLCIVLVTGPVFTTTVLSILLWKFYGNYIQVQTDLFVDEKLPQILLNIFGSSVYTDIEFGEISVAPDTVDKNLGTMNSPYCIKDFYVNSCHRPYIIGDDNSTPTTAAFTYIINAGARYLTFDVFEDIVHSIDEDGESTSVYTPMVRSAYHHKPSDKVKGIPLFDMMKELAATKPFSHNNTYPLILHLNFWSQDGTEFVTSGFQYSTTFESVHNTFKTHFDKYYGILGSTEAGYGGYRGDHTSLGDITMSSCSNRLLLVSNNVLQYMPRDTTIDDYTKLLDTNMAVILPFIYGIVNIQIDKQFKNPFITPNTTAGPSTGAPDADEPNIRDPQTHVLNYTMEMTSEGLRGGVNGLITTKVINLNKTGCGIVMPSDIVSRNKPGDRLYIPRSNAYNPIILDCMNMGYQFILINYQYMGQELENCLQIFKKTSFVLKPIVLRETQAPSVAVTKQSKLVSFSTKNFSMAGIVDNDILF